MMHSRWINGNLAYWDAHQCRIIDAWGGTVHKFIDDFMHGMAIDDTTGKPTAFTLTADATFTLAFPASVTGGVVQVGTHTDDNDEAYLQFGTATAAPFVIGGAAGVANNKPLYFGCRAKAEQHADGGWFVGLAEEGASAANFMADASAVLADVDFVGFNILTATPTVWNLTWRKNGQAVQTVTSAATNADDYHIFEFWYDGATTVTFYVDGVANATVATTTAATFPGAEEMCPIIGVKTGEAVLKSIAVDWIRVVQFD
jgi:hypothetical protein